MLTGPEGDLDGLVQITHLDQLYAFDARALPGGHDRAGEAPSLRLLKPPVEAAHPPHLTRQPQLTDHQRTGGQRLLPQVTRQPDAEAETHGRFVAAEAGGQG